MEKKMVYVSVVRGDDKNSGLDPGTPVRSEAQAIKIANRNGITRIHVAEGGAIKQLATEAKERAKKKPS